MDFWLYNQIPSVSLKTQYRTAIFRKYLHIYFKTYKESILDFIREGDFKEMDGSKLRKQLLKLITDTTQKMEIEMRQIGIPDVIIVKMKSVLNDRINLTMDLINSICDSSFYDSPDNLLKIYSGHSLPEIESQGVPTQGAKKAKPVWGETKISHFEIKANWFKRPISYPSTILSNFENNLSKSFEL